MFVEMCLHHVAVFKDHHFRCQNCGILFTMTFNMQTDELTFWIGEPLEEKDDDETDSA